MKLIYCTNDLLSAHTIKRAKYFNDINIKYQLLGFLNKTNADSKISKTIKIAYFVKNDEYFKYLKRLLYSFFLIFKLRKSQDKIIVRGFEFLIFAKFFKLNVYLELTDIPEKYFKSYIFSYFIKKLIGDTTVLVTSSKFSDIIGFKNFYIFHNTPTFDMININKYNRKQRIIYAGYLRGINYIFKNIKFYKLFHFYGKKNIVNEDYSMLNKHNYKGEYMSYETLSIYKKYMYSFISDVYGINSNFNVTNRLYESIFSGSIPIHFKNNYMSHYMKKIDIFYISSHKQFESFLLLDVDKIKSIAKSNQSKLNKIINRDHKILKKKLFE